MTMNMGFEFKFLVEYKEEICPRKLCLTPVSDNLMRLF